MIKREIPYFSISQICRSGQCFRMKEEETGSCVVIAGKRRIEVSQQGEICWFDCSEQEFEEFWKEYFDLEGDYAACMARVDSGDLYLQKAMEEGFGIRILRQDLWEMIVSFLISQQNHIARIKRCIELLCEQYGEICTDIKGNDYYAFPEPEALAGLPEDALKECNLGYRSKYVVRAAQSVCSGALDLDRISRLSYGRAKKELLKLFGVGEKVADCICLFGLHHLQAFPVDTHIRQALEAHYRRGFPHRRYRDCQGVLQQYIFYYELLGKHNRNK